MINKKRITSLFFGGGGLDPKQSIGSLNTEAIGLSQKNKSLKENRNI
jgi:hypothetical protein